MTFALSSSAAQAQQPLQVFALDIGQGDATLIVSPTGKLVLIDSGDVGNLQSVLHAVRRFSGPRCRLDLYVASHPHQDHIGEADKIMRQCQIASVLDSGFPGTTKTYERFLRAIEETQTAFIKATPGRQFDLGGDARITVLGPSQPFFEQAELHSGASEPNANSVVLRLDHGTFSMLFTGDAEVETESRLISQRAQLAAKVLKVGHHGSRHATSVEFLQAIKPRAATISVGSSNGFGHPAPAALQRLKAAGVKLYRTDLQGMITITSTGKRYKITTQRATTDLALFRGRRPKKR